MGVKRRIYAGRRVNIYIDVQEKQKLVPDKLYRVGIFDKEIAKYANYHEDGTEYMPARPFMSRAYKTIEESNAVQKLINSFSTRSNWKDRLLKKVAEAVKQAIVYQILTAEAWAEPLADSTWDRKITDTMLIESEDMIDSIKLQTRKKR